MPETKLEHIVGSTADPRLLMQRIVDEAQALIPCASGVAIVMDDGGRLIPVSGAGIGVDHIGRVAAIDSTLSGSSLASGEIVICHDISANERVDPGLRADPRAASLLSVPLRRDGHPIGLLVMVSSVCGAFTPEVAARVIRVADFMAIALASVIETARAVSEVLGGSDDTAAEIDGDRESIARFVANVMEPGAVDTLAARDRVASVIAGGLIESVVQPIVDLDTGAVKAVESLSRFASEPRRGPDVWFAEAEAVGLGLQLEDLAVRRALGALDQLPGSVTFGLNISYDMLVSGQMTALLAGQPAQRMFVELTEHVMFGDYELAREAIASLRARGVRVAIDDVGAGYSSFRHVLELAPDAIKLDRCFTSGIEHDRARRAMAAGFVHFAREMGIDLIAEGIETERELESVRSLGVTLGQGYLIARPGPPADVPLRFEHIGTPPAPARRARTGAPRPFTRVR
ncbi:MAG TPA: EAL domain-containing protein [Solirubrobacteraceae bacterium]|jgi:EAL domain-containing protein (putative c-di-GMP-specific phosphodiesterase class I)